MKHGPIKPNHKTPPFPPRRKNPRIVVETPLPDGVRYLRDFDGKAIAHEFEQHDGRWTICGGRLFCRECNRIEPWNDMTAQMRGMIGEFFGPSFVAGLSDDASLFTNDGTRNGRFAGDLEDRDDLRAALEAEFRVFLPDDFLSTGPVSLASLATAVRAALADPATRTM